MKRCPECRRDYYDETLLYCLEDGTALVQGSVASPDEPQTAILHSTDASAKAETRAQIHLTDQTAVLPPGIAATPTTKTFDKRLLLGLAALAVIVLGGFLGFQYFSAPQAINSIAVMPFANDSGNADVEYLSDGMTETLIKSLSGIPDMDVRPRSAVFRYKGKDTDIPTIGKELNVQAVLSGRVIQRGEQLSLSLELVDVQRNRVIWTEQYQRLQSDVVSLQTEIAKDVSARLSPQISGADEAKVSKQATTDPAAYQAYLRGRYYWNKRTGNDIYKAIEQFQIAIDRDPNYALAFAGIADAYSILPDYALSAPSDSESRSEGFARQAIALDGQLAEPHATLGNVYYNKWQWTEAEGAYKRAIQLNPNYATAYHWYSVLLFSLGRNEEAEAAITRAHELDPMSSIISQNYAQVFRMKNDHKSALEICQRIRELDPNFPGGYFAAAWSYLKTGRKEDAIAYFTKSAELTDRNSRSLADLGFALAASGRTIETQSLIAEMEERYERKQANGTDLATIYAALDDKNKAFEWLERDLSARNRSLTEFIWAPAAEPLRADPRFKELIKRMGLPE